MATTVTYNGATFFVPVYDDTGYAQGAGNLSAYLVALATGSLTRAGGSFTLTGDANFGTSKGLLAKYFTSVTSTPATAGTVRLAKTDTIDWRDNANSNNLALGIDGSDNLTFNGSVVLVGGVTSITGTTDQVIVSSPTGAVTLSTPQNINTTSSPTFVDVSLTTGLTLFDPTPGVAYIQLTAPLGLAASHAVNFPDPGASAAVVLTSASNFGTVGQVLTSKGTTTLPVWRGGTGTITGTGTVTPNAELISVFTTTVTGTLTIDGPTNGTDGQKVTFRILNDASHSVTFATGAGNFRFSTDVPSYTNSISLIDYIGVMWNAGDGVWDLVAINKGF